MEQLQREILRWGQSRGKYDARIRPNVTCITEWEQKMAWLPCYFYSNILCLSANEHTYLYTEDLSLLSWGSEYLMHNAPKEIQERQAKTSENEKREKYNTKITTCIFFWAVSSQNTSYYSVISTTQTWLGGQTLNEL